MYRKTSPIYSVGIESEDEADSDSYQRVARPADLHLIKEGQGSKYCNHVTMYNRVNNQSDMEIDQIKQWMVDNRIDCTKYNYSLEKECQNFSTFDGQIQLSEDGKFLYIFNRKPVANDLYTEERNPEET